METNNDKTELEWVTIPDEKVRHVWECKEEDCDSNNPVCKLSPTFYEKNGTPVCDCDRDMAYIRTEILT